MKSGQGTITPVNDLLHDAGARVLLQAEGDAQQQHVQLQHLALDLRALALVILRWRGTFTTATSVREPRKPTTNCRQILEHVQIHKVTQIAGGHSMQSITQQRILG
jgi:hypothetical protein